MRLPRGTRTLVHRRGWRNASIVLLAFVIGAAGCDEFANITDEGETVTIEGTWETAEGTMTIYAQVTSSSVTVYEGETGACFVIQQFNITAQEGDTYTLVDAANSAETIDVILRVEQGQLRVQSVDTADDLNMLLDPSTATLSTLEECTILGTWKWVDGTYTEYVDVTSSAVTVYSGYADDCFDIDVFDIVGQSGDVYTLRAENGAEFDVLVDLQDQQLRVADPADPENNAAYYDRTQDDLSTLEECVTTCSELPAINVGESINGELTTSDRSNDGWYYDLYGLTLDVEQQVQIDLTSTDIDSYLYLYEADGTHIAEDDDGGPQSFDSQIIITLAPGCYQIEATSWDVGATGSYTLSVQ